MTYPASRPRGFNRIKKDINFYILLAVMILVLAIPFTTFAYLNFVFMTIMVFTIFAASWDLLYSYSGQLTFGHALQFGLGAFFFAIFAFQLGVPLILAIVLGGIIASVLGWLVGFTTLRLSPVYQGTALLLLSQALFYITTVYYGEEGLSIFNTKIGGSASVYVSNSFFLYYVGVGTFLPAMLLVYFIHNSKWRTKLKAVQGDPKAAESVGINVMLVKQTVMLVSSFLAGLSGAYASFFIAHVDPGVFSISNSFLAIAIVVIGGIGSLGGIIIGTLLVLLLNSLLPIWFNAAITALVYGALVIVILRIIPRGIVGSIIARIEKRILR